jgi:hypothetical protein
VIGSTTATLTLQNPRGDQASATSSYLAIPDLVDVLSAARLSAKRNAQYRKGHAQGRPILHLDKRQSVAHHNIARSLVMPPDPAAEFLPFRFSSPIPAKIPIHRVQRCVPTTSVASQPVPSLFFLPLPSYNLPEQRKQLAQNPDFP